MPGAHKELFKYNKTDELHLFYYHKPLSSLTELHLKGKQFLIFVNAHLVGLINLC